jgi:hypothetical protein
MIHSIDPSRFSGECDRFGDHFTEPVDVSRLKSIVSSISSSPVVRDSTEVIFFFLLFIHSFLFDLQRDYAVLREKLLLDDPFSLFATFR